MKDNEILDLYWNRDESAISLTADTYGKYCYSVAYNILHNNEDAEECLNDTWVNAWNSIPPHRPNRLSTFLGKITRNIAINRYKQMNTQKRGEGQVDIALNELEGCLSSQMDVEQMADEMVLTEAIDRFLRMQPRTERNIFVGRYWHLYSITELAKAYNMSESKIASMLFRMRNKLKIHLEKEGVYI